MIPAGWLSTQPEVIRDAAFKWPYGLRVEINIDCDGVESAYIVGWQKCTSCGVHLLVSPYSPIDDPEQASDQDQWEVLDSRTIPQAIRAC